MRAFIRRARGCSRLAATRQRRAAAIERGADPRARACASSAARPATGLRAQRRRASSSFPADHGSHPDYRTRVVVLHRQSGGAERPSLRLRADVLPVCACATCEHASTLRHGRAQAGLDGALRAHGLGGRAVRRARTLDARRTRARGGHVGAAARLGQGLVRRSGAARTHDCRRGSLLATTDGAALAARLDRAAGRARRSRARRQGAASRQCVVLLLDTAARRARHRDDRRRNVHESTGSPGSIANGARARSSPECVGWDWFALHLSDGRELDVLPAAHGGRRQRARSAAERW